MKTFALFLAKLFIRLIDICRAITEINSYNGSYVEVGRHTYGVTQGTIYLANSANSPHVKIGNYCSIAPGVLILANADHAKYFPSTYPFRTLLFTERKAWEASGYFNSDVVSRGSVDIGHDVWIGARAIILSGVTIGTGAIIGAGAIVTRDIPPYAIAIGNPARVVKYRFSSEIIERLLATHWWNLPDKAIRELEFFLYDEDIGSFIDQVNLLRSQTSSL